MTRRCVQSKAPPPLLLLLRIHLLQLWRRFTALRDQSRLLIGIIGLFIGGYLALSFWLFSKGLEFISNFPGLGALLTERLMYLLFAFLFALLLLSNLVIAYTNFFRNRESLFLLAQPVDWQVIFRWKFIESVVLASWAFLFLIAPLLAAFGLEHEVPWHFYLVTPALVALFIILPGVAGAWLAIRLARHLDRRSFQITALSLSVLLLAAAALWWQGRPATAQLLESRVLDVFDQLLVRTRFSEYPLLPSYWLSASVLHWADGTFSSAVFFALVLLSNTAFFGLIAFTRLGALFYDTASVVQSRAGRASCLPAGAPCVAPEPGLIEKLLDRFPGMGCDVRALVAKDARMFWRDTTQWGQSVMLFGLLGVYVVNLPHFTRQLTSPFWINLIAYLNLSACSLNLATLTTRFIYPQFSLEGRRLWVIGAAPLGLRRVVFVKYWLACLASLTVTLSMILLSCSLLQMEWNQLVFFGSVVTVMTFALNGLAVGLGTLYPNFKDGNPSKIVSGFGGTLCLVLSFLYIVGSVLLLGFGTGGLHARLDWMLGSLALFIGFSWLVGWLPMRLGLRRLNSMEF